MRKSGTILLSTVFLAAVAAGKAGAQEVTTDTTASQEHHHSSGHGFLHLNHRDRNNHTSPNTTTHGPRTGGFGNSLRNAFTGHS